MIEKALTRPQKRRKRMQLLAANNASTIVQGSSRSRPVNSDADDQHLESYDRLAFVERLVCQVHWQLIGQYTQVQPCDISVSGNSHQDLVNSCFTFDSAAKTFVPDSVDASAVEENVLQCRSKSEPVGSGDGLVSDTTTTCWEPIPAPGPSWTEHSAEQHYWHWRSQSKSMFGSSTSAMREDLRAEAAIKLQRWFRSGCPSTSNCGSVADDVSSENVDCDDDDANSEVNLAVRRAFMASTYSGVPGRTVPAEMDSVGDHWTMEEVTHWMNKSLASVLETEDRILSTRTFWCEWAAVEYHFLLKFRCGTIKLLDAKLQVGGLPSLRELVCIQDGGSNDFQASNRS